MKINFAFCAISLSSSLIAAHEDVLTSRQMHLRKLEDAYTDTVTDDVAVEETYEATVDESIITDDESAEDDLNTVEEEEEEEEGVTEETVGEEVEEQAANAYGASYYDTVASDDGLAEAEAELEDAEEELEEAEEELEEAEEDVEEAMEEVEAEVQEEAEQSYAMKYSGSSNTYSIIGAISGFTILSLFAVVLKKKLNPEKKSDVFLRMEDDNLSVLA